MPCPFCESPDTERFGSVWACHTCAKVFKAYSADDRRLLRYLRIADPEAELEAS